MNPFGLKFSQMILHTETRKRMYIWSFLFVVLQKPTLLPSTVKILKKIVQYTIYTIFELSSKYKVVLKEELRSRI